MAHQHRVDLVLLGGVCRKRLPGKSLNRSPALNDSDQNHSDSDQKEQMDVSAKCR